MANYSVFLDRDDTLNFDPGYLGDPDLVKLYPGVPQGISKLKNELNLKIIVISNQSGITRGKITEQDVHAVNKKINELLTPSGGKIDAFYFCPYHPDFDSDEKCSCRKPSPEMVLKAAKEHNIDLSKSYFCGDKAVDVICGNNAGVKTVLIKNNKNEDQINILQNENNSPNFIAENFLDACNFIYNDFVEAKV